MQKDITTGAIVEFREFLPSYVIHQNFTDGLFSNSPLLFLSFVSWFSSFGATISLLNDNNIAKTRVSGVDLGISREQHDFTKILPWNLFLV